MILPQVHLRNGEMLRTLILSANSRCYYYSHLRRALQRGISAPFFLHCSSAFAGVGLNIKQAAADREVTAAHPIPSLTVSERSHKCTGAQGASLRIAHWCIQDVVTIHRVITPAAARAVFTARRGSRWL